MAHLVFTELGHDGFSRKSKQRVSIFHPSRNWKLTIFRTESQSSEMDTFLSYIESLVGIQYKWWTGGATNASGPFYVSTGTLPDRSQLEVEGCNCAGFLNLLCQKQGLPIAGVDAHRWNAGGTYIWFRDFQARGILQEFSSRFNYPVGTIFIRDYEDEDHQGHIAIAVGNNQIAHCYPEDPIPVKDILVGPGIQIEPFSLSHAWYPEGYYTHVILPEDWLFRQSSYKTQ